MIELKFSPANTKIKALAKVPSLQSFLANKRKVFSFDLISGWSCPFAKDCLSKVVVDKVSGKKRIKDGPDMQFRCFSASQEVLFPAVHKNRWHNFNSLRGLSSMEIAKMLRDQIPHNLGICRIHVGGDFFSLPYMLAWATIAETMPDRLFYAYTKSLPYWVKRRTYFDSLPNLVLTASRGGRRDDLIDSEGLREAKVVTTLEDADDLSWVIDGDDSHAADPSLRHNSFALLLHGTQKAGSQAAKDLKALKGVGSYGRGKAKVVA